MVAPADVGAVVRTASGLLSGSRRERDGSQDTVSSASVRR